MPFDSDVFDGELPQQIQQRGLDSMLGNRKPKAVSDLADMAGNNIVMCIYFAINKMWCTHTSI